MSKGKHNDQSVDKHARAAEMVKQSAAEFISRESNRTALITVTNIFMTPDEGKATLYVTVFPEEMTRGALDFLKRKRDDVRDHLKQTTKLRRIPHIVFEEDIGEKHRRRIDELLAEG